MNIGFTARHFQAPDNLRDHQIVKIVDKWKKHR